MTPEATTTGPITDRMLRVATVLTEIEANILVSHLRGEGIDAWSEGGHIAGFRVEVPGRVNIYVRADDFREAATLLRASDAHGASSAEVADPDATHSRPRWLLAVILAAAVLVVVLGLLGT